MDHFKNIRPYNDNEVADVLSTLTSNQSVLNALIGLQFPGILSKIPFLKFYIKQRLISRAKTINSIDDYQKLFKKLMEKVVEESTKGFRVNGLDQLDKNDSYLFISNHRDITLDAALLALNIYQSGFKTFNIAVGNNLMEEKWASDLFRLNKSFIIQRSGSTKKEIYSGLSLASQFIKKSIFEDNNSIWIAQQQGRAKDGIDETDPALLKMIHLTERKSKSISDYFNSLKVVSVSVSYEFDPNDQLKAIELDAYESNNQYVKKIDEDLKSIANGITGFKGNVTLNISGPMEFEPSDNYQEISNKITNLIVKMYELYPTNFAACNLLGWDWQGQTDYSNREIKQAQEQLDDRSKSLSVSERSKLLEQYANPVIRKLQSH